MSLFYVLKADERRCRHSKATGAVIAITGMDDSGVVKDFIGVVERIEPDRVKHGYPTRITMVDSPR